VLKMLKQKVMKQQEDSKAIEDFLLQRQLALEETIKQQVAPIEKQSAEFAKLIALVHRQNKESNP